MNKFVLAYAVTIILLIQACGGGGGSGSSGTGGGGDITLSWLAPDARADGSELSRNSILGYKVYYGTSTNSDEFILLVELQDGSADSVTFDSPGDDYYYGVTAYDIYNLESDMSNVVSR
jgi:fibronectin type 3 domain-containing protein